MRTRTALEIVTRPQFVRVGTRTVLDARLIQRATWTDGKMTVTLEDGNTPSFACTSDQAEDFFRTLTAPARTVSGRPPMPRTRAGRRQ